MRQLEFEFMKEVKVKYTHRNGDSIHHIIPRSRGGNNSRNNTVCLPSKPHNMYHQLFGNRTPYEIGEYLRTFFWDYKYQVRVI
jgi:5-methylcytosine-specific restriction endonuclease McrA